MQGRVRRTIGYVILGLALLGLAVFPAATVTAQAEHPVQPIPASQQDIPTGVYVWWDVEVWLN